MSSFALSLQQFAKKAGDNADLVVRKIVLDIGTRIVMRSPVGDPELWAGKAPKGYTGGHFRGNWQYGSMTGGVGVPMNVVPDIDPSGSNTLANMAAKVPVEGAAGMVHVIINNLPYAQRLEDGWSKQAPAGMIGLVVQEYQGIVRNAAQDINSIAQVARSNRS